MDNSTINILVEDDETNNTILRQSRDSLEDRLIKSIGKSVNIQVDVLSNEVVSAIEKIRDIISNIPKNDHISVESVTFTLSVDSNGKISLLSATSASASTTSGLTFTLSCKKGD